MTDDLDDLQITLIVATMAREAMDYRTALIHYRTIIQDETASDSLKREALHMRGVCLRCMNQFEAALADLAAALELCTTREQTAHVMRDTAMVLIDRWEPGDRAEAMSQLNNAFDHFRDLLNEGREELSEEGRAHLKAEKECTRGFLGRAHLKSDEIEMAVQCMLTARKGLRGLNGHYFINNELWLVRALLKHEHWFRRGVQSRLYAFTDIFRSLFAKQEDRRIGSNRRAGEFLALLGGEKLYNCLKKRFLKKFK